LRPRVGNLRVREGSFLSRVGRLRFRERRLRRRVDHSRAGEGKSCHCEWSLYFAEGSLRRRKKRSRFRDGSWRLGGKGSRFGEGSFCRRDFTLRVETPGPAAEPRARRAGLEARAGRFVPRPRNHAANGEIPGLGSAGALAWRAGLRMRRAGAGLAWRAANQPGRVARCCRSASRLDWCIGRIALSHP
jgi:hypothetical protein